MFLHTGLDHPLARGERRLDRSIDRLRDRLAADGLLLLGERRERFEMGNERSDRLREERVQAIELPARLRNLLGRVGGHHRVRFADGAIGYLICRHADNPSMDG